VHNVNERIEHVLAYAKTAAVDNYPQFLNYIEKAIPTLRYRLDFLQNDLLENASALMKNGFSLDEVVSQILAWKREYKISDSKLGITGKIDLVYKNGQFLKPRDIKSHLSRFDAYVHQPEALTQLGVYSILLENKHSLSVKEMEIFYSQNIQLEKFKFNEKMKTNILNLIETAREILDKPIPPKLTGQDAMVKCTQCYKRRVCFGLADDSTELIEKFEENRGTN